MAKGLVMRSTGSRYRVRESDGTLHDCMIRGNLRIQGFRSTNPIAVGDLVVFEPMGAQVAEERLGAITEVLERANYLVRRSVNLSHQKHVIAANLDRALLMVTIERPRTSFGFIDRFLVSAHSYDIPVVILFNKVDDLNEEELGMLEEYEAVYALAGYRTMRTSTQTGEGVSEVHALLHGKTSLLAGHSGVGKSTLINAIDPQLDLHTAEVSLASDKGQHTTTYAEMFELHQENAGDAPTFIIDTPGVKGFGLVDMDKDHIGDQFPEMFALKGACRFSNCKHLQEPGCAVLEAVGEFRIAESRYLSYVDMYEGVDEKDTYRASE